MKKKFWRAASASLVLSVGLSSVPINVFASPGVMVQEVSNSDRIAPAHSETSSPDTVKVTAETSSPDTVEVMVTELVPDNTSSDAYEYIELYNPTNRAIPARDYQIRYTYANGTYQVWNFDGDQIIPSKGTAVVWVRTPASEGKTLADFNRHFSSDVHPSQLLEVYSGGMANSGMRAIVVSTDTGVQVSRANYNDPTQDISAGKSNVYKLPADGSRNLVKMASGEKPTPGTALADQVPQTPIALPVDESSPVVEHTPPFRKTEPVDLTLTAQVTDDQQAKRVTLYYKTDADSVYQREDVLPNEAGVYSKTISKYDIMAGTKVQYYFEASDGVHTVTAPADPAKPYEIEMEHKTIPSLSVSDGQFLKGSTTIQGYSPDPTHAMTLTIDGKPVSSKRFLPQDAQLVFEADGLQPALGFKNGVLMGDQVIHLFEGTKDYSNFETIAVPLTPDLLKAGTNTLSIWSGDRVSPTSSEGNNDNFSIRNVRLVLADGTVLRDPAYDSKASYPVNDDIQHRNFNFKIEDNKLTAIRYVWDTSTVPDGNHQIGLEVDGSAPQNANVVVDNTKPVISTIYPEADSSLKGFIKLSAEASDATSGIDKVEATLDGKKVELSSTVAAADLVPGNHKLEVTATDHAGNHVIRTSEFGVLEENPLQPSDPKPEHGDGKVGANPMLMAKVKDPYGDPMKVSFYEAYKYDFSSRGESKAFSNAVDREPPLDLVPQGETAFDEAAYKKVATPDNQYYTTNAEGDFPYQRFEMKINQDVTGLEDIELQWEGHSLEGRRVTLYAWNHTTKKWTEVDSGEGVNDFTLKGSVKIADMVRNGEVQILVQDKIPSPDEYDFSFAWMTDTQYYSASYPQIYSKMTQWLADNAKSQKIDYAIHTGDLVDAMDERQYKNADTSMKILDDAKVPYGVLAGNHDVHYNAADYSMYGKYFGRDRFADRPYYGGDLDNNRDHYDLISSQGNDFVILYLGWVIDQQSIDWANQVLKKYSDRNAIVALHEYIDPEGNYSGQGEEVFEKIVQPNNNVFMVLSGHIVGVSHNIKQVGDRKVLEMLADYQGLEQGGLGYLRLLKFDTENQLLHVNTYSPHLNDYNYYEDAQEEFTVPIALKPISKQVATDYIAVNIRTDKQIGQQLSVPSGSIAKAQWKDLSPKRPYAWYVIVEDEFKGKAVSDVWTFSLGNQKGGRPKDLP